MPATAPPAPADRFACLIAGLCRAVAGRGIARGLAGPLIILLWSRLRRMAARFAALAARVRAGTLPGRPAKKRSGRSGPPPPRLPKDFAWLVRLLPEAAAGGSQLQHLLADPEMADLIAAAPQMGRILRPLCRMLGVPTPPALIPPPRPRAPASPRPAATRRRAPPPAPLPTRPRVPRHLAPTWSRRAKVFGCLPTFPV